ncbi:hypothetical protein AwDysgo_12930 [Bacteroidales bacterium]|nr:hypothetical protein AwDysgo_12930 [Bacteroidales bacterium]
MEYLTNGIAWSIVQRMMIDAPNFEDKTGEDEEIALTENNTGDILNYVNNLM